MSTHPPIILDIVCLCAAWCGTCREYEATFAELCKHLPMHRYRWLDIEDEADLAGEVDIETFPSLLVAHEGRVMFAGPVLPRLADAQRLIDVQAKHAAHGQVPSDAALGLPADQVVAFKALASVLHARQAAG